MARNSGDPSILKENDEPNQMAASLESERAKAALGSSCKKRKMNDTRQASSSNGGEAATANRPASGNIGINGTSDPSPNNWEQLYKELAAERVTKPEQLFYAYRRESEEREKLMRSYNHDLENDNQALKSQLANSTEQKQTIQTLQNQLAEGKATISNQAATIRAFQQMTGATLSNVHEVATSNDERAAAHEIGYDCTMENKNPHSRKARTKFRISVVGRVPVPVDHHQQPQQQQKEEENDNEASEASDKTTTTTLLKYQPLENPQPLPEFLHEEIEFESTELPPLLQNVLRGIFPEE